MSVAWWWTESIGSDRQEARSPSLALLLLPTLAGGRCPRMLLCQSTGLHRPSIPGPVLNPVVPKAGDDGRGIMLPTHRGGRSGGGFVRRIMLSLWAVVPRIRALLSMPRISMSMVGSADAKQPRFRSWPITETSNLEPSLRSMGLRVRAREIDGTAPGSTGSPVEFNRLPVECRTKVALMSR